MRTQNETYIIELNKLNFRKENLKHSLQFPTETQPISLDVSFFSVLDKSHLLGPTDKEEKYILLHL